MYRIIEFLANIGQNLVLGIDLTGSSFLICLNDHRTLLIKIEIGGDTFTKKPNVLEELAYRDTWGR
ncbi:MAG: hypothetical protein MIO93_01730, partial [ANME-2 cluster archaeon]|nr:hypothetical protein [ANME-2 cluster archaeon]